MEIPFSGGRRKDGPGGSTSYGKNSTVTNVSRVSWVSCAACVSGVSGVSDVADVADVAGGDGVASHQKSGPVRPRREGMTSPEDRQP